MTRHIFVRQYDNLSCICGQIVLISSPSQTRDGGETMIDIGGLPKAEVLRALFNGAGNPSRGPGLTPAAIIRALNPGPMLLAEAEGIIARATHEMGGRKEIYLD